MVVLFSAWRNTAIFRALGPHRCGVAMRSSPAADSGCAFTALCKSIKHGYSCFPSENKSCLVFLSCVRRQLKTVILKSNCCPRSGIFYLVRDAPIYAQSRGVVCIADLWYLPDVVNGPVFIKKVLVMAPADCQSIPQTSPPNLLMCIQQSGLPPPWLVRGEQGTSVSPSSSKGEAQLCSEGEKRPLLVPSASVFPWVPKALAVFPPPLQIHSSRCFHGRAVFSLWQTGTFWRQNLRNISFWKDAALGAIHSANSKLDWFFFFFF